jgi:hypothetical protein
MNTIENNKILAEFMGVLTPENNIAIWDNAPKYINELTRLEDAKYHSDWNWLMEVVEKIETTSYNVPEKYQRGFMKNTLTANGVIYSDYDNREEFLGWSSYCTLETQTIWDSTMLSEDAKRYNTKIEAVYNACIGFIKWHNEQK